MICCSILEAHLFLQNLGHLFLLEVQIDLCCWRVYKNHESEAKSLYSNERKDFKLCWQLFHRCLPEKLVLGYDFIDASCQCFASSILIMGLSRCHASCHAIITIHLQLSVLFICSLCRLKLKGKQVLMVFTSQLRTSEGCNRDESQSLAMANSG